MYWTEGHEQVNAESQRKVLNAFGFLWDRKPPRIAGASVLLEKSPPNAVLARFLEALVDFPGGRVGASTCAQTTRLVDYF